MIEKYDILVSSDHHHANYHHFARTLNDGINSRLAESLAVEHVLERIGAEYGVSTHIRCGDLFDKKNVVDAVVYHEVVRILRTSCMYQTLLVGNHDIAAGGSRNTLESLSAARGCFVFNKPMQTGDLYFIPHMEDPKAMKEAFAAYRAKAEEPRYLFAHVGVTGATLGSEFMLRSYLDIQDLYLDSYTQVFLGHIHEPQDMGPNARYLGSMHQRSWSDAGSPRRCILLNTKTGRIRSINLPGPRFYVLEIDCPEDLVELDHLVHEDDYYKVVIKTSYVETSDIDDWLDGRCKGWIPGFDIAEEDTEIRLSHNFTRWEDVCTEYVNKVTTDLNKERLINEAATIIAGGHDTAGAVS